MKKNTTTTATAQAQSTNNTTTTEGANTMKKNATTAQATAQATAPKADSKTEKKTAPKADTKKKSTKKADKAAPSKQDAQTIGFKPKYNEGANTIFSVPTIKAERYDGPDGVQRTEYKVESTGRESNLCKNSVGSAALVALVQKAIVHFTLESAESKAAALDDRIGKEKDGARLSAIKAERESIGAAIGTLKKAYPGAASFVPAAQPHAALVACAVTGGALPVECKTWIDTFASARGIMTESLLAKFAGRGTAAFTEEERATMTALKDATSRMFAIYCDATEHNRVFKLRIKDADIVTWYTMSANGFKGEKDHYTAKVRDKWEQTLTQWFIGKIYNECESATK